MQSTKSLKRKMDKNQKHNTTPMKSIRLPVPLVNKLLDLKKRKGLEFLYRADIEEIFSAKVSLKLDLPLFVSHVQAGSPFPADELMEGTLDLNEHLIKHKAQTFFVRVSGESMTDAGIFPGDLLIVDRAIEPVTGNIIIAVLNGELTVKRLYTHKETVILCAENENYGDIKITEYDDFSTWGVVTNVIHLL